MRVLQHPWRFAALLGACVAALHALLNPHYGFFRDELYFIICGRHPDFGYVDQPPVVPLLSALSQVFGRSLFALRLVPAVCAGLSAGAAGMIAAELGGGAFAMGLAAWGAAMATVLLALGTIFTPDSIQLVAWPWLVWCLLRAQRADGWPIWALAGVILGIGFEAKYSALMAGFAVLGAYGLMRPRVLARPGIWLMAGIALVLALPNVVWQLAHGWPMLELLRNGQLGKNVVLTPGSFVAQQFVLTNPVLSLLWLAGLVWCCMQARARFLAIGYVVLMAVMIALHGKSYYPVPIYPALFGAGGVAAERLVRGRGRWLVAGGLGLAGLGFAPMAVPVLPEPAEASYLGFLRAHGLGTPASENHRMPALDQVFADMHGWPELAEQVRELRAALPEGERERAYIFGGNYGEAAAVAVFAPELADRVIGGHNQYYLWGPRGWDGQVLIDIGGDVEADAKICAHARALGVTKAAWAMPYEDGLPIVLCEGLHGSVADLWPSVKRFD